jgi:hypothetical protein
MSGETAGQLLDKDSFRGAKELVSPAGARQLLTEPLTSFAAATS